MRRRAFGKMVTWLAVFALLVPASGTSAASRGDDVDRNEPVLEWNQIFVDFGPMSAQAPAFSEGFVLAHHAQFDPGPPRILESPTYGDDVNAVKALGRLTGGLEQRPRVGEMHHPSIVDVSDALGAALARDVHQHAMQPLHRV